MTGENPTPADVAAQQGSAATPASTESPGAINPKSADAPPWGEDFDAEKAWSLVQNLRADKEKLSHRPTLTDEQKQKLSEFDKLQEASKSELEKAQDAVKREAERATSLLNRAVKSEVKALAQGFADPGDAAIFLDLSKYATGDGDVDSDSIKADLADLLQRKPHLGKQPETRKPQPNPAQGASASGSSAPAQWSQQDLDRANASHDYDGIEKARNAGLLKNLMGES